MEKKKSSRALAKTWKWNRYSQYQKSLQLIASEWFRKHNLPTHPKMPYCLDTHSNWPKNIILPEVVDYIQEEAKKAEDNTVSYPLHKYLHHGLSSQAMVFNLVGPLIVRDDLSPLISVLEEKFNSQFLQINSADFEYDDRDIFNEDSGQPTSIDLVLYDKNNKTIDKDNKPKISKIEFAIESKLTEKEFGGCSVFTTGDCSGENPINGSNSCYLSHIGRTYWDKMREFGFDTTLGDQYQCIFTTYYQFFREVLLSLTKNGNFVLLYDKRSPVFFNKNSEGEDRGVFPFLLNMVPQKYHHRIGTVSIQELVQEIEKSPNHQDWIASFKEKYGIN